MDKADGAFLTIGELAQELGVAQHILRYWETRFPQLKPLQRSGNRRYYRPGDVEIAKRINQLLNEQGFTVRGAKRVLDGKAEVETDGDHPSQATVSSTPQAASTPSQVPPMAPSPAQAELALGKDTGFLRMRSQFDSSDIALLIARLTVIRENLKEALETT